MVIHLVESMIFRLTKKGYAVGSKRGSLPAEKKMKRVPQIMFDVHLLMLMHHSNRSFNILPGHLTPCPGGREFDRLSLSGGRPFDYHSQGVGNLIASLDFMLQTEMNLKEKIAASWQIG